MNIKASMLYAQRLLFPKSGRNSTAGKSLLGAVFSIGLSLVPLIVVLAVSDGMIEGITSRIIELSSYHMQVNLYASLMEGEERDYYSTSMAIEELAQKVSAVPGVVSAYPERQGIGLAAGAKGRTGATIRAVPEDIFAEGSSFSKLIKAKSGTLSFSTEKSAIIGEAIATILDLQPGDTIRLVTMRTGATGNVIPKITPFTVEAVVSSGYQELDALWVFIPFDTGFSLLEGSLSSVLIGITTDNAFSESLWETATAVEQIIPPGSRVRLWNELNRSQFENFASTRMMLIFIMLLIVLVASVNISSALVMLAMERRKEIAILKSIGATSGGIVTAFLMTGLCTGAMGVLIGLPLGLLCAVNINGILTWVEQILNILLHFWYNLKGLFVITTGDFIPVHLLDPTYYLEEIPVVLPFNSVFVIVMGTLILSVVVSALPSIKAGAEKPLDTLRKI